MKVVISGYYGFDNLGDEAILKSIIIALKEADETQYWLELLYESEIIDENIFCSLNNDLKEIIAIITSSIKTAKQNKQ